MSDVLVNNNQIHYIQTMSDQNSGTLLFIHGAGGDSSLWSNQLDQLPPGFTGLAPDLPGHKQSGGEPSSIINEYADAITAMIKQLSSPRPLVLAGHSMGGAIALTVGLNHPELIDGLVLIGSSARLQVAPQFLSELEAGRLDVNFLGFGFASGTPESIKSTFLEEAGKVSVSVFYSDFTACSKFDVRERIGELNVPLLLLVGEEDRLTPVKLSTFVNDKVAGSKMQVISSAGHFVMLEQPAIINQAIAEFVQGLS